METTSAGAAQQLNLVEVFSSVQGEGPHVGMPTLFVRLGGCDLRCRWCDSPHTWLASKQARFEQRRGRGDFVESPNPVSVEQVIAAAERLQIERHAFVSLTGGEPLGQPEAVRALAEACAAKGPRIHLESHGADADALARVVDAIDCVSMDWKFASEVRRATDAKGSASEPFDSAHAAFLRVALRAPDVVVKAVVTLSTSDDELVRMAETIAGIDPTVSVIVQPVSPSGPIREAPSAERLLAVVFELEKVLASVRLIPQTHKAYGAL